MKIVFTKSVRLSIRSRIATAIILAVVAFLIFFYAVDYPFFAKYKPPCFFKRATGLYCPGCGSSGAIRELLHGNFYAALRFNMFVVVVMPFLLYFYFAKWVEVFIGRTIPRFVYSKRLLALIVLLILIFTVFRNIPHPPFNYLAPTDLTTQ